MSWKFLQDIFAIRYEGVWKTYLMSWRFLQNVFKTFSKRLQDVLKMFEDSFARHLEDVLKTSSRRMTKTNKFVLIKTSSRCLLKRYHDGEYICLDKDVFKTSSDNEDERCLYQDECLLGDVYSEISQTFKMELFAKIVNGLQS